MVDTLKNQYPEFYPKTILDLGTGTGYVPEILLNSYPLSLYILNDNSSGMIERVRNKFKRYNNFKFYVADMENIDFYRQDLIISNFALQWVVDLKSTLQKCIFHSKIFAFTCLLNETFNEWDNIVQMYGLPSVLKQYPTKDFLENYMQEFKPYTYYFDFRDFQLQFPNAHAFMIYLKELGASASGASMSLKAINTLIKNHKTEFTVTYKVFFGIIER